MALNVGELFASIRLDTSAFTSSLARAQESLQNANGGFNNMSRSAALARVAVTGLVSSLAGLSIASGLVVSAGVALNASAEQSKISFEALLGSAERADRMIRQLTQFAKETPFEYTGIEKASISLLNAGFNAGDLQDILTNLGDAVSISGGNIQEKLEGVTLAIGQMQTKGKLSTEELTQVAERGIPVWDALARTLGKSVAETRKLVEDGKVAATILPDLIQEIGAPAEGAMERQSQTLSGSFSTLTDSLKEFLKQVTKGSSELLRKELVQLNESLSKLQESFAGFAMVYTINGYLTKFTENLIKLFKTVGTEMMKIDPKIIDKLYRSYLNLTETLSSFIGSGIIRELTELVLTVMTTLIQVFDFMVTTFTAIGNILAPILGLLQPILEVLGKFIIIMSIVTRLVAPLINLLISGIRVFQFALFGIVGFIPRLMTSFSVVIGLVIRFGIVLGGLFMKVTGLSMITGLFSKALAALSGTLIGTTGATTAFGLAIRAVGAALLRFIPIVGAIVLALTALSLAIYGDMTIFTSLGTAFEVAFKDGRILAIMFNALANSVAEVGLELNALGQTLTFGSWDKQLKETEQSIRTNIENRKKLNRALIAQMAIDFAKTTEQKEKEAEILNKQDMTSSYERIRLIQEEEKRKQSIILQAKAGVKSAIDQVKNWAENGSAMALEALAQIDKKYFNLLLSNAKARLQVLVEELNLASGIISLHQGALSYEDRTLKKDPARQQELKSQIEGLQKQIELMNKLSDEYETLATTTTTTTVKTPEQIKEDEFEAFKKWIEHKKALNEISLNEEINAWTKQLAKYKGKSIEEQNIKREINEKLYALQKEKINQFDETEREKITKMRQYGQITTTEEIAMLTKHYKDVQKMNKELKNKYNEEVMDAEEALTEKRLAFIDDKLSKEWEEISSEVQKRNQQELDALTAHYNEQRKIIDDGLNAIDELYEKEDVATKRAELNKELQFLERSFDKDAMERVVEINKELKRLKYEEERKIAQEEAEIKRKALDEQEKIALAAQEEINANRLKAEEEAFKITSDSFRKQALDIGTSVQSIAETIDGESKKVEKAGVNFIQALIDGMNSKYTELTKIADDLAQKLDFTNIGLFKNATQLFSQIDINKAAEPDKIGKASGTFLGFYAPILSVNEMKINDKIDANIVGSEIWNGLQNAARSQGVIITGRV